MPEQSPGGRGKRYRLRWDVVVLCEATVDAPDAGYARDMLDDIANNLPQTITLGSGVENVIVMEIGPDA